MQGASMVDSSKLVKRLGQALGSTIVPMANKRPMLLDRVFRSALERMGFNNPDDRLPEIREAIAERFLEELGPVMTEAELHRMRTLVYYGLDVPAAARLFNVPETVVNDVVAGEGKTMVRVKSKARA
jgi:hypothetical protein